MEQSEKIIIYQVFTRLFGNEEVRNAYNGSLQENGCGKKECKIGRAAWRERR